LWPLSTITQQITVYKKKLKLKVNEKAMGDLFFFLEKPFKFSFGANDSFVRFVDLEECDGPKSERQPET